MIMLKRYLWLAALFSFILSTHVQAENSYYISENLSTILRAGSSDNFRVNGSVIAGEEVVLLDVNNETNYAQIKTSKGKVGWLPLNMLKSETSAQVLMPKLKEQVSSLTAELESLKASMQTASSDYLKESETNKSLIDSLKQENAKLIEQLDHNKVRIAEMEKQLDEKQLDIALKWCLYGGGVAGAGLFIGLILPYLIPRRKSRDRWMN